MSTITKWFINNPIAANLLMAFTLIAGYLSFNSLRVESFPQIPPSQLIIEVTYPGGTPQQVDQGITQRIEDAISGVAGIKNITSSSYAGFASIVVKKSTGVDLTDLLEKVRNQVDSIVGFPARAERPKIYKDEFGNLASFIMVYGGAGSNEVNQASSIHVNSNADKSLQEVATFVTNALKKNPNISKVTNLGKRRKELTIAPDKELLKKYGLSHNQLADIITRWSLEYRSGELDTARGKITLKADNYADTLPLLAQLPIITYADSTVRLGDIAEIKRDFAQSNGIVRYNGKPAIALMVSTSQKDNLLDVSKAAMSVLNDIQHQLPAGVQTDIMADMAPYIEEQVGLLATNAWQGLLIVIVLLAIFLEVRLAFWVAMGIPISIAGAVWLMDLPLFDYSINDITLFGMILVLGILVDDAVVVGESIHDARSKYSNPKEAAYKGVEAVSVATIFGVLTTIAAFSPMLWIENELAQILAGFSAVVIFALIFSLIESKFILPTHLVLAKSNGAKNSAQRWLEFVRKYANEGLNWFSANCYQPTLKLALEHKGAALSIFLILVVTAYGAMSKGAIRTVFFPEIPGRYAQLIVEMDQDAAVSLTRKHLVTIEKTIALTNDALVARYNTADVVIAKSLVSMDDKNKLEVTVELSNEALNNVPSNEFIAEWQKQTGKLEGSYAQKFTFAEEPAGGTFINISAPSRDVARQVAQQVKLALASQPGVNNVSDDSQAGKRQLTLVLNSQGVSLGITQQQLAYLVGGAFGRIELHRLLDRGEESLVVLRLPEQDRRTEQQLMQTPVLVGDGLYATIGEIADINFSREPEVLHRKNRNEVVSVYWRQDKTIAAPQEVWQKLLETEVAKLEQQYPGVSISAGGEFEEILEVQSGFKKAMLLTLLLIYVLLAIPLKSYWQPFIIMSVIPFGFAGAIYGHGLMGLSVSLLSLFGMMAMTGVVINDSLVLMTRFNQLYREGMPMKKALIEAGKSRLRAIFLTTVTTVCGLLPLLSETSEQAQYLKPAAVSLVFGELFATPITLILIPVLLGFGKYKPVAAEDCKAKSAIRELASTR